MASSLLGVFCIFLIVSTITATAAAVHKGRAKPPTEFRVGGKLGWREPDANHTDMYELWATKNRFRIGDSLYFEYRNDSVLEVEKQGYYHCNMTATLASFNDGKTVINLDQPGPFYFISGALEHCKNGQRLLIDVINPNQTSPPSRPPPPPAQPSIAVSPQPDDSPAPSPLSNSGVSVRALTSFPVLVALATFVASLV
ncbi:hypothetical protein MKW94_029356 [Papaver nudicaule]|uniref:Phytocyanin domain-containing protein n=1 Tax=Papaver nudicaule TaxID=74823 RepID=A0AA41RQN2_PAPNU|nr:hypothetical protein [Papaver nudicaule]